MIVTLPLLKLNMHVEHNDDDTLIAGKAAAAQAHIERLLGFKIEERYGGTDQEPVPPELVEIVYQLVGHWYENREAVIVGENGVRSLPHSVWEVVREYREYSFDG
ncbi:head-tail connector protein [Rhizobium sp.]